VDGLLRPAGPRPATLATPPRMVEVRRDGELIVNRLRRADQGVSLELTDSSGAGHYELLLDQRPFILEAGCRLRYGRTHARLYVDLVAADGRRLGPPPAGDEVFITVDLSSWQGARIEEVLLVYDGGVRQLRAEVAGLGIRCDGDPD